MSKNSEFAKAIDVTFSIGLDTKMGDEVHYDEDGDPYTVGEITFADVIAQKAAIIVADSYKAELKNSPSYKFDPLKIAEKAIEEQVAKIVADTLARITIQTDDFGTPKGEPQTIAEILSGRVEKWLKASSKPADSYGRTNGQTNLDVLLTGAIGRDVTQQIQKATIEARDAVTKDLKAVQQKALSDAVEFIVKQVQK